MITFQNLSVAAAFAVTDEEPHPGRTLGGRSLVIRPREVKIEYHRDGTAARWAAVVIGRTVLDDNRDGRAALINYSDRDLKHQSDDHPEDKVPGYVLEAAAVVAEAHATAWNAELNAADERKEATTP